jgi:hypothetical protein
MRLPLLCLLAATALHADALSDLRTALQRLQGREPIKARVEVSSTTQDGSGKKAKTRQNRSAVLVEDGPAGLRLGWTAEQMEAARAEARNRRAEAEAATPNLDALRALNAEDASELLGAAPALLLKLSQVKVLEERPEVFAGRPTRFLHLQLEPVLNAEAREVMKKYEQRLKVWLDADGTPLATEESLEFKGSKFLISFGGASKEHCTYRKVGARLVAERATKENSGSGMGFSSSGRTVVSVAVL